MGRVICFGEALDRLRSARKGAAPGGRGHLRESAGRRPGKCRGVHRAAGRHCPVCRASRARCLWRLHRTDTEGSRSRYVPDAADFCGQDRTRIRDSQRVRRTGLRLLPDPVGGHALPRVWRAAGLVRGRWHPALRHSEPHPPGLPRGHRTRRRARARCQMAGELDPNARLDLWSSPAAFVDATLATLPSCDIVKVAEDELALLGGSASTPPSFILDRGPRALLITYGADGARLVTSALDLRLPGFPVPVVDTTGAGDVFVGAFLNELGTTQRHDGHTPERAREYRADARVPRIRERLCGGVRHPPRRHPAMPTRAEAEGLTGTRGSGFGTRD